MKTPLRDRLASETNARVIPHPGHGKRRSARNGHRIDAAYIMNTAAAKHRVAKIFRNGYFIFGICAPLSGSKHCHPRQFFRFQYITPRRHCQYYRLQNCFCRCLFRKNVRKQSEICPKHTVKRIRAPLFGGAVPWESSVSKKHSRAALFLFLSCIDYPT